MRRTLFLWSLASIMVVQAACGGRTDMPTSKVFDAVTPAAPPPPAPTPTTAQVVPPTSVPAPPPTQPAPEPTPASQRVQVTGAGTEGVNMRAEPSTTAARVKGLLDGNQLEIVGADRQADGRAWRNVKDPADGAVGWVAADFLATVTTVPPISAPPAASPPVVMKPSAPAPTAVPVAPAAKPAAPVAPAPTAVPKAAAPAAPAAKPAGNCHASYPDFCIPPPPPDINCTSPVIGGRKNFRVTGPDVHRLDQGGRPGIACES